MSTLRAPIGGPSTRFIGKTGATQGGRPLHTGFSIVFSSFSEILESRMAGHPTSQKRPIMVC